MTNFSIGRRQLYILPTRIGWYFMLMLIAIFAIAVKFDNQAAFLMLFILVSVGMLAMLYTHNNVIGLNLSSNAAKPVYLGETIHFSVGIHNQSNRHRNAVWLACDDFHALLSIKPHDTALTNISLPSQQRGYQSCPKINLTSQYPLGIFFCWTKAFTSNTRCLVYPKPIDFLASQDNQADSKDSSKRPDHLSSGEDYSGMKAYQAGDRLRDIHWPSLAKSHKLITVQHEAHRSQALNLSWFALPSTMSMEDKLSQLSFWLVAANQQQLRYQLEMPGQTLRFSNGAAHLHECLSLLALWKAEADDA